MFLPRFLQMIAMTTLHNFSYQMENIQFISGLPLGITGARQNAGRLIFSGLLEDSLLNDEPKYRTQNYPF